MKGDEQQQLCVDVSSYEPVVWREQEGEQCRTDFVQQCEERSEKVCGEVTETICEVNIVILENMEKKKKSRIFSISFGMSLLIDNSRYSFAP